MTIRMLKSAWHYNKFYLLSLRNTGNQFHIDELDEFSLWERLTVKYRRKFVILECRSNLSRIKRTVAKDLTSLKVPIEV